MTQLDTILGLFHDDLRRTRELLELTKEFRNFAGSTVPSEVKDGTISWPEAMSLASAAPRVRTDIPILSGSMLLYICGRFEYFVREVVLALADDIVSKVTDYEQLSAKIRDEILAKTLDVVQNHSRYGYTKSEAEQMLISLGANLDTSGSGVAPAVELRVLTLTEANMHSRTVSEVLRRVNITDLWTEVGRQAVLKVHLSVSADRECKEQATSKLDALMKERNSIAHPTGVTAFPDPDRVIESANFLQLLSQILVDIAKIPRV